MRVLIVEDHPGLRMSLQLLLQSEGIESVAAARGEDALEVFAADASSVNLILLDINTDGMTASEFVSSLRKLFREDEGRFPRLGILSGSHDIERHARQMFADFFIRKPFDGESVVAKVREALGSEAGQEPLNRP